MTCYSCSSDPTDNNYASGCNDPFNSLSIPTVSTTGLESDDTSTACLVNELIILLKYEIVKVYNI